MYPRYYPQRGGLPNARTRQQDVVPRELAAKIARERDMLYEELQRTQQAFKRGEQQRAELQRRLSAARPLVSGPTELEQQQAHKIRVLEEALADMTQQRDAAEYSAQLFSELDPGQPEELVPLEEGMNEEEALEQDLDQDEQEHYSSHEDVRGLIGSMLELRDSIERASAMSSDVNNPWKQGLDHMVNQFDEILSTHGWVGLGEVGEPFDPTIHEAIGVHDAEQEQEVEIHEVSRRGFAHEATGEILRPAQVIVSK